MTNKRQRRTKSEIERIRVAMFRIAETEQPVTCRQLFYRLVSMGEIEKTEQAYKGTIIRLLTKMRLDGDLPFEWIADHTRWMRKPKMFTGLRQCVEETRDFYRRDLWAEQDAYCEVWCEKNALAGVLMDVTAPWGVPLMISVGFASLSYLYESAEAIAAIGKPTYILYLGDHDPSGLAVAAQIENRLKEFVHDEVEIVFHRLAVTPEQIEQFNLPTRPTKTTDSRAKTFKGESVEVDAIAPSILRELVDDAIKDLINGQALERTLQIERLEKQTLGDMHDWLAKGSGGAA